MTTVIGIVLVIVALILIAAVLMQDSEQNGMSAITGAAESFLGKKKAKGFEAKLALITKICAVVFVVLCILLMFIPQGTKTAETVATDAVVETATDAAVEAAETVAETAEEVVSDAVATDAPATTSGN